LERYPAEAQFDAERLLIDRLQETRSQVAMDLNGSPDHGVCELVCSGIRLVKIAHGLLFLALLAPWRLQSVSVQSG